MLVAKPQLTAAQSDKDKDFYENKCAVLDRQIDALVYELYALTPEEIKVVEGARHKMTGGSQAAGGLGRAPCLLGRIVTGIFSRCDGTGQPVNP